MHNLKKFLLLALVSIIVSSATSVSYASLIEVDLHTTGDALITRDTSSGLEWLDITQTINRSFGYMSSQFGNGGEFEGFRYATANDIRGLWVSAGLTEGMIYFDTNEVGKINVLGSYIGFTNIIDETLNQMPFVVRGTIGLIGEVSSSQHHYSSAFYWSEVVGLLIVETSTYGGAYFDAEASDNVGSFLVRDVIIDIPSIPEPATIALMGLGLIGLSLSKKCKLV